MEVQQTKNKKVYIKWLFIRVAAVFFVLFLITSGAAAAFGYYYQGKIYPGVSVAGLDMGGKTFEEARDILKEKTDDIFNQGLTYDYRGKILRVDPVVVSTAGLDFSYEILNFKVEETLRSAERIGRRGRWLTRFYEWGHGAAVPIIFELNEQELKNILSTNFRSYESEPQNAGLLVKSKTEIEVAPEKIGRVFDYEQIIAETKTQLAEWRSQTIALRLNTRSPEVKAEEITAFLPRVRLILANEPYIFKFKDQERPLGLNDFSGWLEFLKTDGQAVMGLNQAAVGQYLDGLAKEINVEAQDAKFALADGRVKEFLPSRDGISLRPAETAQAISAVLLNGGENKEIEAVVEITKPSVPTEAVNDLGIKEIIGVGQSNFAGSPANRRHNIANGAAALNGILIPPDPSQEFSLIEALGAIDGEHGYLPELVIKGNRTIPEYGGGLCQIGTTMFRVALNTGLQITERRPHSYRVSYYEPAGLDATIYGPHPDLRFINDTGHHILLTTEAQGDDLTFTMWGTADGRSMILDPNPPLLYNITSPGPTKIIETPDLEPGQEKWLERAHAGADTKFTQKVTYTSGEVKEKIFESHYRAWPAVKLVGVEAVDPSASLQPDFGPETSVPREPQAEGSGSDEETKNPAP